MFPKSLCTFIFQIDGGLGCVLMVYGLNPERMNCDRLFNLFCLYGNVIKVNRLNWRSHWGSRMKNRCQFSNWEVRGITRLKKKFFSF